MNKKFAVVLALAAGFIGYLQGQNPVIIFLLGLAVLYCVSLLNVEEQRCCPFHKKPGREECDCRG